MNWTLRFARIVAGIALLTAAARGDVLQSAVTLHDIDYDVSGSFHNGEFSQADATALVWVLGLDTQQAAWSAGEVDTRGTRTVFHYLIAFTQPIEIGTIMAGTGRVRYLKEDAPYPPDIDNDDHWITPPVHPYQHRPLIIPLPTGTKTRAVFCTETIARGRSQINTLRLSHERLLNVAMDAVGNANEEFTMKGSVYSAAPVTTYAAADVPRARRPWIGNGLDDRGQNLRPPVSTIYPSWYVLSWQEPQEISAIFIRDNFTEFRLHEFIGPIGMNPVVATDREWRWLRNYKMDTRDGRLIVFENPITTRGLKFAITKVGRHPWGNMTNPMGNNRFDQSPAIWALQALRDLGDEPVPEFQQRVPSHPPFAIPYELEEAGSFTLVIEREDGTRARNVVARVQRNEGENFEHWDLKDEEGFYVTPGAYRWRAITAPPLELRYEMTPYPNVKMNAADRAPWLTAMNGPDGWMADHTPPRAVATYGDKVFLGSPVCESGVALTAHDLDGRKLWGHGNFASFTGAWWVAADADSSYVGALAHNTAAQWNVERESEIIWGVDNETQAVRRVALLQPTATRKRGAQSMLAHEGYIYMSIWNREGWLQNAVQAADVDIERAVPRYAPQRAERYDHEVVPHPRNDFLRLFRLTGTPPGIPPRVNLQHLIRLETLSGPGRKHIVLPFHRPVSLGSVVFPFPIGEQYNIKLSVLKSDAPYPPDHEDESQWIEFENSGSHPWDAVPAPPNTVTRALRISFYRGTDDVFGAIADDRMVGGTVESLLEADLQGVDDDLGLGEDKAWQGNLDGMKLLRRRYVNIFPEAKVHVNSGFINRSGIWDADRDEPLTEVNPGIYMMEWEEPKEMRGLAIKEIDGSRTLIDIYTGPADGTIDMNDEDHWDTVATYRQNRRNHWSGTPGYTGHSRYVDGYVDFGEGVETRAVRLRVVEQWADRGDRNLMGVRADQGGQEIDATRCRIYGIAVLQYIGGEDPVDALIVQRIEKIDVTTGKIADEVGFRRPGAIAIHNPTGTLFTISEGKIFRVDMEQGNHSPIEIDAINPTQFAVHNNGNFYVFDADRARQNVRVYNSSGEFQRIIGTPGGYQEGPWDVERFGQVTSMAIDSSDQLWVVQTNYWPKRVVTWTTEGEFVREFLGNTPYGGGGQLDPYNKNRLFFGPMEFELDWEAGETRLKNMTTLQWHAGDVPTQVEGRTYLTNPKAGGHGPSTSVGMVFLHKEDRARLVAAIGNAGEFDPLKQREVHAAFDYRPLHHYNFMWSDLNGDGIVQPEEVDMWPIEGRDFRVTAFSRDLSVTAGNMHFTVKEFLPDGVPVYQREKIPHLPAGASIYRLSNGNFWRMEDHGTDIITVTTPDGQVAWTYKTEGLGVHSLARASSYHPAQVVAQFGLAGRETAHAGDLGEFLVFNTNLGAWNIFTADGLLAGRIFHDQRTGAPGWRMKDHQRGLMLDDITIGQEHFAGYFCKTPDDRYYAVAGHNHASIVEVIGLDRFRRLEGEFVIGGDELEAAQEWEREYEQVKVYERAPVMDVPRMRTAPRIDGNPADWDFVSAEMEEGDGSAIFRMGYDDRFLFLCYEVENLGPLVNTGKQHDMLFKTGASVDLQLGTSPEATHDRRSAGPGDIRLLMTYMDNKPVAVLYEAVVPGIPADERWNCISPTGSVTFDRVRVLDTARISARRGPRGYTIEAAIPLNELGLRPQPGLRLKVDWGLLMSGPDGHEVLRRIYWSNKATWIIADAPSEARLHPHLWGWLRFGGQQEGVLDIINPENLEKKDAMVDDFLEDLIEDMK